MRYAIIADIHANLEAFTAVLDDIRRHGGVDEVWCLGDTVGYGPDPGACIALLRETTDVCVAGNHDWAAAGTVDTLDFNPDAAAASRWTARQLSPTESDYVSRLPLTIGRDGFTLVHGSPREPIWEYLNSPETARQNLSYFQTPYCAVGHTHRPMVFTFNQDSDCAARLFIPNEPVHLGPGRLILNPGGIGQPRDGDARAGYAIYDADTGDASLRRVTYDFNATQRKMVAAALPAALISRLSYGL